MPLREKVRWAKKHSKSAFEALKFDWDFWVRPAQREPLGDWITWIVMAGRGFGKTRVGAEWTRKKVKEVSIVNLVARTAADLRDVMVEGPSGIMTICPNGERPLYQPSKARLVWPNGALSKLYSAEEPEALRGPQCYAAWTDELAAWQYIEETWDQLMFGLRLGKRPQVCVTTTPKPLPLIKALVKESTTRISHGSTYDNRQNLATTFLQKIITKYEGTRLGRQELMAEILDDNPNALWKRAQIDALRIRKDALPPLVRVAVGVDPAVTKAEDSDETGIIAGAVDGQVPPHFYILSDDSFRGSPSEWASRVVTTYYAQRADRVVAEVNNGGDLVEANLRNVDPNIPYKAVHASRGKLVRAEPIAALYEQGRVHHVGSFGALEDQMCDYVPGVSKSPDRMDAAVWVLSELSGDNEDQEIVVTHQEYVSISPDLDELEDHIAMFGTAY